MAARQIPAESTPAQAKQAIREGVWHIWSGYDHILFLLALLLPSVLRRTPAGWVPADSFKISLISVLKTVTAFTIAHSITLIASAYNLAPDALWFPPLIETLIATSIVYMALENIVFATQSQKKPQSAQSTQTEDDLLAISASSAVFSSTRGSAAAERSGGPEPRPRTCRWR